jgi:type III protein arginine methyltransferase
MSSTQIIELRNEHSTETPPLEPKAQVCISELLEDGLLGEGWLPAMRDAWTRHLAPDAIVIPSRACVYGQFVYYDREFTLPSTNDIVFGTTTSASTANLLETTGRILPVHTTKLLKSGQLTVASDVFSIFDFDVTSPDRIPGSDGRSRTTTFESSSLRGRANAVMVWWKLWLDADLWYEMDPHNLLQDHWHPCLHFIPQLTGQEDVVTLYAAHDDERITVRLIVPDKDEEGPLTKKSKVETEQSVAIVSTVRSLQLGLGGRLDLLRGAIHATMQSSSGDNNLVLDVSDFPIAGCIAAKLGAKRVVSLESSSGDLPTQAARMVQLANRLENVEVFHCYPESLTVASLGGLNVDIVVAEPYYEILEGWHVAEALHLYGILQTLRTNQLVTKATRVVPSSCQIRGCLIECHLLQAAYRRCGDQQAHIQGIDHSFINDLAWSPQFPILSIPLWQYEYTELSEPFDLGFLSYSSPETSIMELSVRPSIKQNGRCDGLMVWVTYNSGAAADQTTSTAIWSTNGYGHNQLVQMAQEPFHVTTTGTAVVVCRSALGPMVNGKECHRFQIDLETSS